MVPVLSEASRGTITYDESRLIGGGTASKPELAKASTVVDNGIAAARFFDWRRVVASVSMRRRRVGETGAVEDSDRDNGTVTVGDREYGSG